MEMMEAELFYRASFRIKSDFGFICKQKLRIFPKKSYVEVIRIQELPLDSKVKTSFLRFGKRYFITVYGTKIDSILTIAKLSIQVMDLYEGYKTKQTVAG
jgi:hypothetical protein